MNNSNFHDNVYVLPHSAFILANKASINQFNASKILHAYELNQTNYMMPWEVEFHLTSKCDLKCKCCSYSTRRTNSELSVTQIKETILSLNKAKSIFFSGGGDPFTWNHWDDLINVKKNFFDNIPLGVSTNLYGFKNKISQPWEIDFYQIHVPGYDKESCILETGIDCYDQIFENIKELLSYMNKYKKNNINFKFIINNNNYNKISNYLDFLSQFPADSIVMKTQQNFLKNKKCFKMSNKLSSELIKKHSIINQFDYLIDNIEDSLSLKDINPSECHMVKRGMYCLIRENGDVFPCIASTYDSKNSMGNINIDNIVNILNNFCKRDSISNNMIKEDCPLNACRHFRFNKIIEEYKSSPDSYDLDLIPIPILI